ncbi:MAG: ATP synthase F1 subunit epsilon [Elusimicrobia bacterium GWC2_65_9]|nr:MAG: ATP synthase F1 subunit epsilon [Elusimicrobia bacterium GWA2_66_18]OGR71940.1 MAG: ATP synthase F1 subunit epsilon [Elusimicrobia bacterium GWC2_65_9]
MDKRLTLELVTPEKVAWSAGADFVVLPALEGEMGVLPGHQSFLVGLTAGEVRIKVKDEVQRFAVSGGFAEVKDDKIALFAETAEMSDQIDAERAKQALERAKLASVKPGLDPLQLAEMEAAIRRAQIRLRVVRHGKTVPPHLE